MSKSKRKPTVILVKHFRNFPDKLIYRGNLKRAKRMIPPSKREQYEIRFLKPQR